MLRRTLHARFQRVVLAVSAVLLLAASVVVFRVAHLRYLAGEHSSVRALVSAVDKSLAVGAYARDRVLLQELLDGLARHPTVRRVETRDAAGAALLSAGRAPAPAAEADIALRLLSPFDAVEPVGELRVWLDAERLSAQAGQQAALLAGTLVVFVVSVLAAFNGLARRLLTRPMRELAANLAAIAPGTHGRVPVPAAHADDEVGTVAHAANRLLELQEQALAREREMREAIAAMEARYRGIFDASSAGIFVLSTAGEVQHANPALWRLLGCAPGEAVALPGPPFADPSRLGALIERARASAQPESDDLELRRADGRSAWVHCMLTAVDDPASGRLHIDGVLYDITSRHERERATRHQAEHDALTGLKSRTYIESLLDACVRDARARDGAVTLMFFDLDGFKRVNDCWGHAAGDAVLIESAHRLRSVFKRGSDVVGRLGGDELVVVIEDAHATDPEITSLAARAVDVLKRPFELPSGDRATIGASVGLASYPMHATSAETLLHAADAAMYAVKKAGKGGFVIAVADGGSEAAPQRPGVPGEPDERPDPVDALTGLPDRRGLAARLARAQAGIAARGGFVAVVCVDLDDFKSVNLAHGPQAGDEVLCEAARRLRRALRHDDVVARTGSDEFVALIANDAAERSDAVPAAQAVVDKLRFALAETSAGPRRSGIAATMGVSLLGRSTTDGHQVLQEAQLALRLAKSRRRGGVLFFEPDMMDGFLQQRALEDDLRRAVAADELRLLVQPQVDLRGRVCGGEALLRWQHPVRGLVPPAEFIPLAEASGAIVDIGRWVLRRGCEILVQMNRRGERRTLAVNISPLQFNQPEFVADVFAALEAAGAPPQNLILEITEGLLLSDLAQVGAKIRYLATRGVRFSIDDFGTGFSSLGYLKQLPLHEIKIDRSFIAGLPGDPASVGIVRSILSMGRHLGLNVVAEGVETQAQSDFLALHDCAVQQGWLHGRPCPADGFVAALRAADAGRPRPAAADEEAADAARADS